MYGRDSRTQSMRMQNVQNAGLRGADGEFWWRDISGHIYVNPQGVNAPTLAVWRGNTRRYFYGVNNRVDTEIHEPHSRVVGSDLYFHIHWGHNGTAISGDLSITLGIEHTRGHRGGVGSNLVFGVTAGSSGLAGEVNAGRYFCEISEWKIGMSGGGVNMLDTDLVRADDSIAISVTITGIPTITGGTRNEVAIWNMDLHAQTTGIDGTPNKDVSSGSFW